MSDDEQTGPEVNWPVVIFFVIAVGLTGFFSFRSWRNGRILDAFRKCELNCTVITTAARMYANDNAGLFPKSLDQLITLKYLAAIPTCPAAGKMTYTDYQVSTRPPGLTVSCVGGLHEKFYRGQGDVTKFPSKTVR
jgi:hypothetical protein